MCWLRTSLTEPSPNLSVCSRSFSAAALRLIQHLSYHLASPLTHAGHRLWSGTVNPTVVHLFLGSLRDSTLVITTCTVG
ncbi:hypothetical protein ZIOFF_053890 [Zingiber officinale]|uniref:Uncharacterized protein n=1 Tax=Zingiber officinale TaxID=94328 RepID=A0A8J5FIF6_ZINOF|nr:hypothetical protein ZIOFF_053890 [Zingiber officinale]